MSNVTPEWVQQDFGSKIYLNPKIDFFHESRSDMGFGCVALDDIHRGELLLSVPYNCCLWPDTDDCHECPEVRLMRSIVAEHSNGDSRWRSYLEHVQMSGSLDAVPVMWPSGWNTTVKGSSLGYLYSSIVHPLVALDDIPKWVIAFMLSRSFASERVPDAIATVPFADQFNHSTDSFNTRIREIVEENRFVFYAETGIARGEEIYNCYGALGPLEMFVTHGFTDGTQEDVIIFPTSLMADGDGEADGIPVAEDALIRIDVNGSVPPDDLVAALPLPEFVPSLVAGLKRAISRMIHSSSMRPPTDNVSVSTLLDADVRNLHTYLDRLNSV